VDNGEFVRNRIATFGHEAKASGRDPERATRSPSSTVVDKRCQRCAGAAAYMHAAQSLHDGTALQQLRLRHPAQRVDYSGFGDPAHRLMASEDGRGRRHAQV